jgi:uncharacterized protein CbrC (UPF0167 family)
MTETLPQFRYYRDPFSDGTFRPDPDIPCLGCSRLRGYVYTGPVYTEKNFILEDHLCPWCIADGTAAKRFGAIFNDAGTMDDVSEEVRKEIEERTPGFHTWQDWGWLTCCEDATQYLGAAGAKELKRDFPDAIPAVMALLAEDYDLSGKAAREFFDALSKDDQPTAYIFQCTHCHNYLPSVDET